MNYARIENNIVMEVFDFKPEFHKDITILECNADTQEGYIYQNGVFLDIQKDIETLRSEKISLANSEYRSSIEAGFTFEGNTYQIDSESRENMSAVYTKLVDGQSNPHGGLWRDINNNMNPMDDAKVRQFIDGVFTYLFSKKQVLWGHKDNLRAMTRSEDIESYDVTNG